MSYQRHGVIFICSDCVVRGYRHRTAAFNQFIQFIGCHGEKYVLGKVERFFIQNPFDQNQLVIKHIEILKLQLILRGLDKNFALFRLGIIDVYIAATGYRAMVQLFGHKQIPVVQPAE